MKIDWNPQFPDQALQIVTFEEMSEKHADLLSRSTLFSPSHPIHFCKVMFYQGELSGTFVIPQKAHPIRERAVFGFILYGSSLFFIGDSAQIQPLLTKYMDTYDLTETSPFEFLLRFLNFLVQEDAYFLENYNEKLEEIEEDIFDGKGRDMERFIMITRKDMNILDNYYLQLSAVGEAIEEAVIPTKTEEQQAMISLFLARVSHLLSMVDSIKDYTSQIWNLRQTQLSDKQNKISTLLTIVTAIFLPLTLITGWFGMNFDNMPLIHEKAGYYIIVGLCILIVIIELCYLKIHHWLNMDRESSKL